jgi:hypothetical protein
VVLGCRLSVLGGGWGGRRSVSLPSPCLEVLVSAFEARGWSDLKAAAAGMSTSRATGARIRRA